MWGASKVAEISIWRQIRNLWGDMPQQLARPPDSRKTRCLSTSKGAEQDPWHLAKMQHVTAATQLSNAASCLAVRGAACG